MKCVSFQGPTVIGHVSSGLKDTSDYVIWHGQDATPTGNFLRGSPPHVRACIELLHNTIADLRTRIDDLEAKQT